MNLPAPARRTFITCTLSTAMNARSNGESWQSLIAWVVKVVVAPVLVLFLSPASPKAAEPTATQSGNSLTIRTTSGIESPSDTAEPQMLAVPGQPKPIKPEPPPLPPTSASKAKEATGSAANAKPSEAMPSPTTGGTAAEAWTHWEGGRPVWRGASRDSKRQGIWTRWFYADEGPMFDDALLTGFERPFMSSATFVDDVLEGPCTIVDARRRTICELTLRGGELEGPATWFYIDGKQRVEANYREGLLHGRRIEWDGAHKRLNDDEYERGRKLGHHQETYTNDRVSVEGHFYLPGDVIHQTFDWSQGRLDSSLVTTIDKDQRTGVWTWWHANGQKQLEGQYEDDRPTGVFCWYYSNAQKQSQGAYVDGKRDGVWTTWHTNGQKESEGRYFAGEKASDWLTWSAEGQRQNAIPQTAKPRGSLLR